MNLRNEFPFASRDHQTTGAWYNPFSWWSEAESAPVSTAPTNPLSAAWQGSTQVLTTASKVTSALLWVGAAAITYTIFKSVKRKR